MRVYCTVYTVQIGGFRIRRSNMELFRQIGSGTVFPNTDSDYGPGPDPSF